MKHLITFLTLVLTTLLPLSSMAAPVSPEKAREKAIKLFSSRMQTRAVPEFELIWDGETAATRSTQDAALYIFDRTDGPGFIIIAGDDAVPTVLGYSFEHNFGRGTMPENLHYWLSCQRQMVLAAREAGAPTIADLPELGATQVLLETADWDQSEPYNRQTPLYGGQPTLTGCVATAAAIVCKYNQWPDMGNGPTTSYTTRTRKISVGSRELTAYDYSKMPNVYTRGQYTDAQANEVSRLMADIGAGVKADYGRSDGTSAFTNDQLKCMTSYMRYSKEADLLVRYGYTDEEWAELMRKEIDANRPVLYSASTPDGAGHAFVLDGYSSDGMFAFNWGWSGSSNGFYNLSSMVAGGWDFAKSHEAIVGLVPDKEGTTSYRDRLIVGTTTGINGMTTDTQVFHTGTSFKASVVLYSWCFSTYVGKANIALIDKKGEIKELLSTASDLTISAISNGSFSGALRQFNCAITATLAPGDCIVPVYWERTNQEWVRARAYSEDAVDHIVVMEANPDGEAIASGTELSFNRTTKDFTIQTYAGTTLEVLDKSGKKLQSQTVGSEPIVLKNLAAGSYTVRIYFDADEPFEFKLTR
ncbi:MAG: C10 family peptidase [Alistipes sp.]|nr:C10 family peptidase [Alistipes sp.]MBQ5393447.1 C10 family peptidase [Alistipes sp.]